MALRVNTNTAAINAQRNLEITMGRLNSSLTRLSSGLRINSAADDAAGLAISENLRSSIRGLGQAVRNANDGISLLQIGEGAMGEQAGILTRLRELALQSANGTLSNSERGAIDTEFQQLLTEIDRIAATTEFAGMKPLASSQTISFQVGLNSGGNNVITVSAVNVSASTLGLSGMTVSTTTGASATLDRLSLAINQLSSYRAGFGATQNRLQVTIRNLQAATENESAAESRIRDVDVAAESSELVRDQILQQSGIAVLAQANSSIQAALKLLAG
ncbi:MAG: flagellin FliC [Deltaproteobacteria bacterium]|nr:flagellin FliC [Deltaproteobacteria bacterium]